MSRIPILEPNEMTTRQREVHDAIASGPRGRVRGPLAAWLYRPELADRAQALGRYCRYETALSPRLSELAILVTARIWSSEFEWQAHKAIALEAGVEPAIVEAIRQGGDPKFSDEAESAVYDFARAVQVDRRVDDALYERMMRILGREAVVDLTGLLGYYSLISITINVFEIDPLDPAACELG